MKKSLQFVSQNACNPISSDLTLEKQGKGSINPINSFSRTSLLSRSFLRLSVVMICLMVFNLVYAGKPLTNNVFIDKALVDFPTVESTDQTVFQLFSHGRSGELFIDGKWKNAQEIATFVKSQIHNSKLDIKNLNIYGCEFAKGKIGEEAVSYLESTLSISVAASTNLSGNDGDWILEMGQPVAAITVSNYQGNLQNLVQNGDFSGRHQNCAHQ